MSCVVMIFIVWANSRKAVIVKEESCVRGNWCVVLIWVKLCIVCMMWINSVSCWGIRWMKIFCMVFCGLVYMIE